MENINIEEQYKSMTEIEHVLARSGMYIGNINGEVKDVLLYKPSENKIIEIKGINYNAGLLKLFDEVFTNPIDSRRDKKRLFDITEISVDVNTDGTIKITDNGGIPVIFHNEMKIF